MAVSAATKVCAAEVAVAAAGDGQMMPSEQRPAEENSTCACNTPHDLAVAALERWKAANPWWNTAKNKQLPQEFWDLRRRARNTKRSLQQHAKQKEKRQATKRYIVRCKIDGLHGRKAALLDPEEASPEHTAQRAAAAKAAKQQRTKAQLAQRARVEAALQEGLRLVVDCSFITACSAREMRSLAKQLQQCVAVNRRATRPACLTFAAYTGPLREFCQRMGGERWAANRLEAAVLDTFPASSLVMLSPDAAQPLEALDPGKVFCVGGLVDRSPRKGITAAFAEQHGIEVRRLPIEEQQLKTADGAPVRDRNFILNVDSVVAALLGVHGGSSWAAALDAVVPMRKRLPLATVSGTSGKATGTGTSDADGDATAHAADSETDSADSDADAATAHAVRTADLGSLNGLTQRQQQSEEALAQAADAASREVQLDALSAGHRPSL